MTRSPALSCSLSLSLLTALPFVPAVTPLLSKTLLFVLILPTMSSISSALGMTLLVLSSRSPFPSSSLSSLRWSLMTNQQLADAIRLLTLRGVLPPQAPSLEVPDDDE